MEQKIKNLTITIPVLLFKIKFINTCKVIYIKEGFIKRKRDADTLTTTVFCCIITLTKPIVFQFYKLQLSGRVCLLKFTVKIKYQDWLFSIFGQHRQLVSTKRNISLRNVARKTFI